MTLAKSLVLILMLGGFFVLCVFTPKQEIIKSERRPPAAFQTPNARSLASGDFFTRFEQATPDNFPFREQFRTLRAVATYGLFLQTDKNGLYIDEYGIGKIERTDVESVSEVSKIIDTLAEEFNDMNVYYSFIPDKSVYAQKPLPGFDCALVNRHLTPAAAFIDLTAVLNADSYYRTDLHWNQTALPAVVDTLAKVMGFKVDLSRYAEKYAGNFEGVYAGQLALPAGGDEMRYLDNFDLTAMYSTAAGFEQGPVYDVDKFNEANGEYVSGASLDPYDLFLSGAQPLVTISNNSPDAAGELILFRDSFSSSLAPLLADGYKKVTLIDLRYIDMQSVRRQVEFAPDSDVLFLYSSQILNNADSLLI
jgi:hypothetical protein